MAQKFKQEACCFFSFFLSVYTGIKKQLVSKEEKRKSQFKT